MESSFWPVGPIACPPQAPAPERGFCGPQCTTIDVQDSVSWSHGTAIHVQALAAEVEALRGQLRRLENSVDSRFARCNEVIGWMHNYMRNVKNTVNRLVRTVNAFIARLVHAEPDVLRRAQRSERAAA